MKQSKEIVVNNNKKRKKLKLQKIGLTREIAIKNIEKLNTGREELENVKKVEPAAKIERERLEKLDTEINKLKILERLENSKN